MTPRHPSHARDGYTSVVVLVFLMLLLSLLGLTYRQVAAVLRVETARSGQVLADEGTMAAAAQGLEMLENGPPSADPYVFNVTVGTSAGPRTYVVSIASEGPGLWSVNATPYVSGS